MTHPPPTPQRRKVDTGRFPRFRTWWERWGGLVRSAWYFTVTVVLLWAAIGLKQSQSATAKAAKQNCQRSRQFGPRLIDFYEWGQYSLPDGTVKHVLTHPQADAYRASIPRVCPGDKHP